MILFPIDNNKPPVRVLEHAKYPARSSERTESVRDIHQTLLASRVEVVLTDTTSGGGGDH